MTLQLSPLQRGPREPASYEIFRQLVDYLLRADIRGRVKLPSERSLAETFGVGRATVREALRTMEMLDLIEVRTGDGTYVKSSGSTVITQLFQWSLLLRRPDLRDLLETRLELETAMARRAATRHSDPQLAQLIGLLEAMRTAKNDDAFVEADVAFHLLVGEMAGIPVLSDFLAGIQSLLDSWMHRAVAADHGRPARACEEHEAVLTAIAAADPDASVDAMTAHLRSAEAHLLNALQQEQREA